MADKTVMETLAAARAKKEEAPEPAASPDLGQAVTEIRDKVDELLSNGKLSPDVAGQVMAAWLNFQAAALQRGSKP